MKLVRMGVAVLSVVAFLGAFLFAKGEPEPKANKYIGVEKCKKCHDAKTKGEQVKKWSETKHAKAFEALASDKAKEIAKAKGIADPQKDDQCIKCHTTGFDAKADWDKNFKAENVQCEACHGPGEKHFKARMADESDDPKADDSEINKHPDIKTCTKCHNEESPTYKPFCFKMRYEKIMHPLKPLTAEELKKIKCSCGGDCDTECKCKSGDCGGIDGEKNK